MSSAVETLAWVASSFSRRGCVEDAESSDGMPLVHSAWQPLGHVGVSVDDVGFRQSVVAVERLRTYNGRVFELHPHLIRYRRTLDFLGIDACVEDAAISSRIDELIAKNQSWCAGEHDFGITMLATPGEMAPTRSNLSSANDYQQTITQIVHLNPLDHQKIRHHQTSGQPLVVTDVKQPPAESWPRDIKVRCRLHYYLADRRAREFASGGVGVLIDADGSVTETSVANLAMVVDGEIVSPPREQVLPGVTQDLVQRIASQRNIPWRHETIYPAELRTSDEIILMGTDGGIWFANRVDGHPINGEQTGEIYKQLLSGFDAYVKRSANT
jgi:branched-chain amino acid aminotransferase